MIDIHTHILPSVDDGAKNVEISREMLQAERAQGVETVVITPHYYGKFSPERFLERRSEAYEQIKDTVPEGLELRLGAEVHFTGLNMPEYDELCRLAIEGTHYILIEFPFQQKWNGMMLDKLSEFAYETGYTPIIAHVERYGEVRKNPAVLTRLAQMGCLIQVNTRSFLDKKEKGFAFTLVKHNLVHCIGSDAHDTDLRAPDMQQAKAAFVAAGYAEEWERIQLISKDILADKRVFVSIDKPVKKFFGRYF